MNNHLMDNQERIVKWKCPECGNYHKWVWSIYDIIGGEITMVCDNPECGATSKMYMVVEKNGNATALVADNSEVEEKLRRATEKVMNSQTEIDISKVLMDGDIVTIMGEKYQRIIEPQSFYDKLWELLDDNLIEWVDTGEITVRVLDLIRENIPEHKHIVGGIMEYNAGYNECIREVNERLFE
jgi:predicted RNA-binding protein (virulence factor B family)